MNDPFENLRFVSHNGRDALRHLARELAFGNLVLFAGAGLSFNAPSTNPAVGRMPSWSEIGDALREQLEPDIPDSTDVLRIADYYETRYGRSALINRIKEIVNDDQHEPGRVHLAVAELGFSEIITTNFDTLLERAFRKLPLGPPQVIVEGADLVRRRRPSRIIKMNGCFERKANKIVITSDDFLGHRERDPLLHAFVTKSFVESQVLFIGFGLNDPSFRAINDYVMRTLGDHCPKAYSLQVCVSDTAIDDWAKRHVDLIDLRNAEPEMDDEERIYQVLRAFLEYQRLRRNPAPPDDAIGEILRHPRAVAAKPSVLSARLARLAPHASPNDRAATLQADRVATIVDVSFPGAELSTTTTTQVHELLSAFFAKTTRAVEANVRDGDAVKAISAITDLIVRDRAGLPVESASEAGIAVLSALQVLYQAVLSCDSNGSRILADRLLAAAGRLGFDCLLSNDVAVRSRFLFLLLLLGPLDELAEFGSAWAARQRKEDQLPSVRGQRVEPTPDEYRVQILSFFGALQKRPTLYQQALDSLWSGQLANAQDPDDATRRHDEATRRYRYLVHLRLLPERPAMEVQQRRMEPLLGYQALQDDSVAVEGRSSGEYLMMIIQEFVHGYLFGSKSTVRGLKRTWSAVMNATRNGRAASVPWLPLLATTLLAQGEKAISDNAAVLMDGWHQDAIDVVPLLQFIARRVGAAKFCRSHDGGPERPVETYERGLAALLLWILDRIDEERDVPCGLRAQALSIVTPIIDKWLLNTKLGQVRVRLLDALSTIAQWDAVLVRPMVHDWVESQMKGTPTGSLKLARLNRRDGRMRMMLTPDLIRRLIAHARLQDSGGEFRRDVEEWVVDWSDSLKTESLKKLAEALVEWITPETDTFEWIAQAARIHPKRRLTVTAQRMHPIRAHRNLGSYVMHRLKSVSSRKQKLWLPKRNAFLGDLAVFVPDLGLDERRFLFDLGEPKTLNPDGRDSAAVLAARVLEECGGAMPADYAQWVTRLQDAIECGATGSGKLGGSLPLLSPMHIQLLQDNLLKTLARRLITGNPEIVDWIGLTIKDARPRALLELETELCTLLLSPQRPFAAAAARVLVRLAVDDPHLLERHCHRLARARSVILSEERAGSFRASSLFMHHLNTLSDRAEAAISKPMLSIKKNGAAKRRRKPAPARAAL